MMHKIDATNGTPSTSDNDGRWEALQCRLDSQRAVVPHASASRKVAGCDVTFWSEDVFFTVSATQCGILVGYLAVLRKDGWLWGGDVAVKKAHRRNGIATSMYDLAEHVMNARFKPCVPHTVHAAAFWADRLRGAKA